MEQSDVAYCDSMMNTGTAEISISCFGVMPCYKVVLLQTRCRIWTCVFMGIAMAPDR